MANKTEDKLKNTDLRSLWSETLVELMCEAVSEDWSEHAMGEIIKELYNKGYKTDQIIAMIDKRLGAEAAGRLAKFIIE